MDAESYGEKICLDGISAIGCVEHDGVESVGDAGRPRVSGRKESTASGSYRYKSRACQIASSCCVVENGDRNTGEAARSGEGDVKGIEWHAGLIICPAIIRDNVVPEEAVNGLISVIGCAIAIEDVICSYVW